MAVTTYSSYDMNIMEQIREYFANDLISGLLWGSVIVAAILSFIASILGADEQ